LLDLIYQVLAVDQLFIQKLYRWSNSWHFSES